MYWIGWVFWSCQWHGTSIVCCVYPLLLFSGSTHGEYRLDTRWWRMDGCASLRLLVERDVVIPMARQNWFHTCVSRIDWWPCECMYLAATCNWGRDLPPPPLFFSRVHPHTRTRSGIQLRSLSKLWCGVHSNNNDSSDFELWEAGGEGNKIQNRDAASHPIIFSHF